ncbi:MAG: hypothetical protein Q8M07_01495 [Prosthecobacter sp.]|nr:hypothetical protein [Prosthecobacter sp.]
MRLPTDQSVGYCLPPLRGFEQTKTAPSCLLLCKSAKKTVVELTLSQGANIRANEYQLIQPSKELLKQKLDEWGAAKV